MEKPRPDSRGRTRLTVSGWFAAFRAGPPRVGGVRYALIDDGAARPLPDVQWADWEASGRLLAATVDGRLQVRDLGRTGLVVEADVADLSTLRPEPAPAPDLARHW